MNSHGYRYDRIFPSPSRAYPGRKPQKRKSLAIQLQSGDLNFLNYLARGLS